MNVLKTFLVKPHTKNKNKNRSYQNKLKSFSFGEFVSCHLYVFLYGQNYNEMIVKQNVKLQDYKLKATNTVRST